MDLKGQLIKLGKTRPELRGHLRCLIAAVERSTYKGLATELKREGWYIVSIGADHVRASHDDLDAKWVEIRLEEDEEFHDDELTMSIHFDDLMHGQSVSGVPKRDLKRSFYRLLDKSRR